MTGPDWLASAVYIGLQMGLTADQVLWGMPMAAVLQLIHAHFAAHGVQCETSARSDTATQESVRKLFEREWDGLRQL